MIFDITIWYFIVNNAIFILDDKQLYAHYVKSSRQEVLWKKGTKNLKIAIPFLSNVDRSYEKTGLLLQISRFYLSFSVVFLSIFLPIWIIDVYHIFFGEKFLYCP